MNRTHSLASFLFLVLLFIPAAGSAVIHGDLNCDETVNVVDVQISILKTLGAPLDGAIDGDGNDIPDACDGLLIGTCGEGTILANGVCVIDATTLQLIADEAYATGYTDGMADAPAGGSYMQGYDDALAMCVDLGGSTGACINYLDITVLDAQTPETLVTTKSSCFQTCFFSTDAGPCVTECIGSELGVSQPCSSCFADEVVCLLENCTLECIEIGSEACNGCAVATGCSTNTGTCTGMAPPPPPVELGACENVQDQEVIASFGEFGGIEACGLWCLGTGDSESCYNACFQDLGMSVECGECYTAHSECVEDHCLSECVIDATVCDACADEFGCNAALALCATGEETAPPQEPGSCGELYYCLMEANEEPLAASACYAAADDGSIEFHSVWKNCTEQYWDDEGGFASDALSVLAMQYMCADKLAACLGPEGYAEGSECLDTANCLSQCQDNAECMANCASTISYESAGEIASVTQCAYTYCTDETNPYFPFIQGLYGEPAECVASTAGLLGSDSGFGDIDVPCACSTPNCPVPVIQVQEGEQVIPMTNLHLFGDNSTAEEGAAIASWKWQVFQPSGSWSQFNPNNTFPNPTFQVMTAGEYIFQLTVEDSNGLTNCAPATVSVMVIPDDEIHIELVWTTEEDENPYDTGPSTGTDLDLHFTHPFAGGPDIDGDGFPDGWFDQPFDAFWFNKNPNWGSFDPAANDDPAMIIDDTDGWGPEIIVFNNPEQNKPYRLGVHYWHDHDFGPSEATIRIYHMGLLAFEWPNVSLNPKDMWDVVTLEKVGAELQFELQCSTMFSSGCIPDITADYENPFFFQP